MRGCGCLRRSDHKARDGEIMDVTVIVTSIATVLCTILTVYGGNKLIAYRIEQLEKKVAAHNNLIERMYAIEKRVDVDENRLKVSEHRIEDLEKLERGAE